MTGALFLAGGGTSEQSFKLDALFIRRCKPSRPLVYIPTALRSQPPAASLDWFRSAMAPHHAPPIVMWHDLMPTLSPEELGGVYIGGGDTLFLLQEMLRTGFDAYLRRAHAAGVPVYGGSAGAIILGARLGASMSAVQAGHGETEGIGLVAGHMIACHFADNDVERLQTASLASGLPVIAIPEAAGVIVEQGKLHSAGPALVTLLDGVKITTLAAGETIALDQRG